MRARVTAEIVWGDRSGPIRLMAELREMHFGGWEGLTWDEIILRWPELDSAGEKVPMHYTPEGGESWDAFCARIEAALRGISAQLQPADRALVVCHAGVLHAIVRVVKEHAAPGSAPTEAAVRFSPCGILRARGSFAAGWEITAVNETAPALAR